MSVDTWAGIGRDGKEQEVQSVLWWRWGEVLDGDGCGGEVFEHEGGGGFGVGHALQSFSTNSRETWMQRNPQPS